MSASAINSELQAAPDVNTASKLVEMASGFWISRCLHTVADLAVADALADQPRSAAELAQAVGANADALDRVLRLLSTHRVFERRDGKYSHNAASRALRSDHPHSLRAYVRLVGLPFIWNS